MISDTLRRSNDNALKELTEEVNKIRYTVATNRYQPKHLIVMKQAQAILHRTTALSERLRQMQAVIMLKAGGKFPYLDLESQSAVKETILRTGYKLSADSLYMHLRSYSLYMHKSIRVQHSLTMFSTKGVFPALPTPSDYRRFYFENTSVAESIGTLAQQEAEILQVGLDGVLEQARKVGLTIDIFEKFAPYAVAESNSIRAGEKYKAKLFLLKAASEGRNPRMTANGASIKVDENGIGHVEFTVPDIQANQQSQQAIWEGTVAVWLNGKDSTFRISVPYTIHR